MTTPPVTVVTGSTPTRLGVAIDPTMPLCNNCSCCVYFCKACACSKTCALNGEFAYKCCPFSRTPAVVSPRGLYDVRARGDVKFCAPVEGEPAEDVVEITFGGSGVAAAIRVGPGVGPEWWACL